MVLPSAADPTRRLSASRCRAPDGSYGGQALAGDPGAVPQVGTVITGVELVLPSADHLDRWLTT